MFENLKQAVVTPLFELVNSFYTPAVVGKLISAELESVTEETFDDTLCLQRYITGWVMICRGYGKRFTLNDVYRLSAEDDFTGAVSKEIKFDEEDDLKDYLSNEDGRKLFVKLYQSAEPIITVELKREPDKSLRVYEPCPNYDIVDTYGRLKAALDKNIYGQEEAKQSLIVGVIRHLLRVEQPELGLSKSNIIMTGPTGCGKTEMVRVISKVINVPLVTADTTKITASGYKGRDASDVIADLLEKANYDVDLAERGIVYLDEIDKMCIFTNGSQGHEYKTADQTSLLTLIEGEEITIDLRSRGKHRIKTDNILFIAGGAFGIKSIKETDRKNPVGFLSPSGMIEDTGGISHTDLIRYGMIKELAGRFTTIVRLRPLSVSDLYAIATAEDGILSGYEKTLSVFGENVKIPDNVVRTLCAEAHAEGIGARGLKTIFDRYFEWVLYSLLESADKKQKAKEEHTDEEESECKESGREIQAAEA